MASTASGVADDVGGDQFDAADAPAVGHRGLPLDRRPEHVGAGVERGELGLQHDRFHRRRHHPADRLQQATGFVERVGEAAEGLGETDEHEVAEGVALELAVAEAVLERLRPHAVVAGERDEAPADVAGRRHAEVAAEPARRPAVVGHAHDRGDRAGVPADGAQRGGESVPAPERDDGRAVGRESVGRESVSHGRRRGGGRAGDTPCASSSRASSDAITTLR